MRLEPLLDNLSGIRRDKGKYEVQLEITKKSTLTENEIEKILALSTWKINPNQEADGYEGSRSVLVRRKSSIKKGPIELKALQISGIGHRKFDFLGKLQTISHDKSFYPPNKENFMSYINGTKMSTSHAEGRKIIDTRPKYRALGTYTYPELKTKLRKTKKVSDLHLEKMVVPHVEAYGRFLNPELQNKHGNFGFIVFPVPDIEKPRLASEFVETLSESILDEKLTLREAVMAHYYALSLSMIPLVEGLRELHDKGRRVHLQPHLSNFYLVDAKSYSIPYVMDWATTRRLGNNKEENIINRTIDLKRPADNYDTIFSSFFPKIPEKLKKEMSLIVKEVVMEVYSKKPEKEINFFSVGQRVARVLRKNPTEFEVIVEWMKDLGLEEFSRKRKKIGRNDPCPCGSKFKYKKCCGKY